MQSSTSQAGRHGGNYLETEVLTATPQKLQLLMIEGAIRFILRAKAFLKEEQFEPFCEAVIRAEEIVCEIMAVMDPKVAPELIKKVASVYLFVYRRLMDANMTRDERKLDEALQVLNEERATWQMVCEKLGGRKETSQGDRATFAAPPTAAPSVEATAAPTRSPTAGAAPAAAGYGPPRGSAGTYAAPHGAGIVKRPAAPVPLDLPTPTAESGFSFEA